MVENEEGKRERGVGGLHQGETVPVGSRQFQAIAPCSLGSCLHTRTHTCAQELTHTYMRRQMTINGYNNAESLFSFFGLHSHVFCF